MFLDLLFPNRCISCERIITSEEIVCALCFNQIHFTHHDFLKENSLKEQCRLLFPVQNAFALMQFEKESMSRKIIHQLKYAHREKLGGIIAKWALERINFGNETPDLITAIPLHPKKLKERGYNQLHLFAKTLSENLGVIADFNFLKKNEHKKAQAKKSKKDRKQTENIFSMNSAVSHQHILIIDDVFTTGNTLSSAAWEILKNPGNRISVLVMALDK